MPLRRLRLPICACFLLLTMALVNSNYSRLMDYSEQFISFMHLYRFPMILNINYMRSFLNIGNQAKVIKTIQLTTQLMRAAAMSQKTIKTLFDPALNSQRQYSANEMAPDIINVTYNRIDLFFTIVNSIVAINSSNVDLLGFQYKRFAALLKPSYDIMANSTKFNLHNQFQGLLSQSKYFTIIITIVGVFITIIPSLLMFRAIRNYLHKQEETYQIIHHFRGVYYQQIIEYLTQITTYFQFATNAQQTNHHKYRREQQTFRTNDISNYGTLKQPCPPSNKQAKKRKIFYFVFLTFIGLMVFTFATFQMFNHTKLSNLQILEDDGFSFLHFFPAGAILAMGSIEKFYHQNHPSHFVFDNTKYDDAISSVHLFGSIPYKTVSSSASPYLQKRKNYFFGNLCQYNSSLLKEIGLETSVCQKISNGSFKQGISAYLRYSRSFGGGYLKGEFSVTPDQIDEYIVSVSILNVYVLDTLTSWIQEFKGDCSRQQSLNQFLGYLFAGFIILLHFILNQMVLKRRIKQNNLLKRHTFQYYIPRNIILEDKQVRLKLEENGMFNEK